MIEVFGLQAGTLFQLLTTIFGGGIFGVLVTGYLRNRKITVDAEAVLRTHFGAELERLSEKAIESDRRHEECEAAKRILRKELDDMHADLRGLQRQLVRYSAEALTILDSDPRSPGGRAPEATASAERVRNIVEEPDE